MLKQLEWYSYDYGLFTIDVHLAMVHNVKGWPQLTELLRYYQDIFQELRSLPPHREHDHGIVIKPKAQLVNVRPYRYATTQKTIIKEMVRDMLKRCHKE